MFAVASRWLVALTPLVALLLMALTHINLAAGAPWSLASKDIDGGGSLLVVDNTTVFECVDTTFRRFNLIINFSAMALHADSSTQELTVDITGCRFEQNSSVFVIDAPGSTGVGGQELPRRLKLTLSVFSESFFAIVNLASGGQYDIALRGNTWSRTTAMLLPLALAVGNTDLNGSSGTDAFHFLVLLSNVTLTDRSVLSFTNNSLSCVRPTALSLPYQWCVGLLSLNGLTLRANSYFQWGQTNTTATAYEVVGQYFRSSPLTIDGGSHYHMSFSKWTVSAGGRGRGAWHHYNSGVTVGNSSQYLMEYCDWKVSSAVWYAVAVFYGSSSPLTVGNSSQYLLSLCNWTVSAGGSGYGVAYQFSSPLLVFDSSLYLMEYCQWAVSSTGDHAHASVGDTGYGLWHWSNSPATVSGTSQFQMLFCDWTISASLWSYGQYYDVASGWTLSLGSMMTFKSNRLTLRDGANLRFALSFCSECSILGTSLDTVTFADNVYDAPGGTALVQWPATVNPIVVLSCDNAMNANGASDLGLSSAQVRGTPACISNARVGGGNASTTIGLAVGVSVGILILIAVVVGAVVACRRRPPLRPHQQVLHLSQRVEMEEMHQQQQQPAAAAAVPRVGLSDSPYTAAVVAVVAPLPPYAVAPADQLGYGPPPSCGDARHAVLGAVIDDEGSC